MKRHWNECHSGEKLPFACDECDVRKHSKATLISHKKKWHKPRKMQKCDMCDFQTDHTATMTRHLRCVHLNLKGLFLYFFHICLHFIFKNQFYCNFIAILFFLPKAPLDENIN